MRVSIFVLLFNLVGGSAFAATCPEAGARGFSESARLYMANSNLIREGEESVFPEINVSIKWQAYKVVGYKSNCLVVMAIAADADLQNPAAHSAYEVFGYDLRKKKFVSFESLVDVPGKLIAKIGDHPDHDRKLAYYYVELAGASAADAMKSVVTETTYAGFSGVAVLGEKAPFDPTPRRDWKIIEGRYDLRRGMTGETMDIQSYQFDGLGGDPGSAYWQGCARPAPPRDKPVYCQVAPWGQASINEIVDR